jgi:hypothetical protein
VSYDGNTSTDGSVPPAQTVIAGESAIVAANTNSLAKAGYAFSGWSANASGSGPAYEAGIDSITPTENTVLFARWLSTTPVAEKAWIQYPLTQSITVSTPLPAQFFAQTYNPTAKNYEVKLIIITGSDPSSWIEVAASENLAAVRNKIVDGITKKEYVAEIDSSAVALLGTGTYWYTFKIREQGSVWFYITIDPAKVPQASLPSIDALGTLTVKK